MLTASIYSLLAVQIIVCFLMILIVLMQRPKSEGLGAAFGGGMTENLFGAQTTSVLATFTRWLGGIFLFLSLILSILYSKQSNSTSAIQQQLMMRGSKAATAAPAAAAAAAAPAAPMSSALPASAGSVSTAPGAAAAIALGTPTPAASSSAKPAASATIPDK